MRNIFRRGDHFIFLCGNLIEFEPHGNDATALHAIDDTQNNERVKLNSKTAKQQINEIKGNRTCTS